MAAIAALTVWLNPFEWNGTDWAAIGVLTTIALALIAWLGSRARRARAQRPQLIWSALSFHGANDRVRPQYGYAIGFQVTNVGDGPATHIIIGFTTEFEDEEPEIYAEIVQREVLLPGEPLRDYAGLRGRDQADDPTEDEARSFFSECVAFAQCWDVRGRPYLFFPAGGGPSRTRRWWWPFGPKWPKPHELLGILYQNPSRGEHRGALGMGRIDDRNPRDS